MRTRLGLLVWLLAAAALACNSKSSSHAVPLAKSSGPEARGAGIGPLDPREPHLAHGLLRMLENEHLLRRPVDEEVSRRAFAEYLRMLDPSKLFLLKGQVAELEVHADRVGDQLRAGHLELARVASELLAERRALVTGVVEATLAEPFDFTVDEEIETDPSKFDFAATEEELADRWKRHLKLQALERVTRMEETADALAKARAEPGAAENKEALAASLDEIPKTFEEREKKARQDLASMYAARFARLARTDPLRSLSTFLNAVATAYDPHTTYMAPVDKATFDIHLSGTLEGIGAVLGEEDHYVVVRELVPGGASWRQGKLEAGDLILAVAQKGEKPVDVADMPLDQVVQMIRGPKDTVVTLTIRKPDGRVELISITRDVVEIESSYARGAVLDVGGSKVGYIYLPSFYGGGQGRQRTAQERNAAADVRALLERFRERKLPAVVLDLRGNGGGLLDHARDITGLFIDSGPVVMTRHADGKKHVLRDESRGVAFDGEVVVLVDRFSASASEIVAGALQDYRRAVVVGTGPTHGKGTVQALFDLDWIRAEPGQPLGVVKLTIQQFYRVSGESTQWRGVKPDIVLPDPIAHIESGERYLDNPIPWGKEDPLDYQPWTRSTWDLAALTAASNKRRATQAAFARVDARAAYLKGRRDLSRVPLARDKWLDRRARERKALEAVDPKLDEGPARMRVTLVDYSGRAAPRRPDGRAEDDLLKDWIESLSRDPWATEAAHVATDMTR